MENSRKTILEIPERYNGFNFVNWNKKYSFENKDNFNRGYGNFSEVYDLKNNLIGKTLKNSPFLKRGQIFNKESSRNLFYLENELNICSELFELGINVPKPNGLFLIHNTFLDEFRPAFVMEKIKNIDLRDFRISELTKISKKVQEQIKKAESLGFIPSDDVEKLENVLYDPKNNKVYLIDFAFWTRR